LLGPLRSPLHSRLQSRLGIICFGGAGALRRRVRARPDNNKKGGDRGNRYGKDEMANCQAARSPGRPAVGIIKVGVPQERHARQFEPWILIGRAATDVFNQLANASPGRVRIAGPPCSLRPFGMTAVARPLRCITQGVVGMIAHDRLLMPAIYRRLVHAPAASDRHRGRGFSW